MIIFFNRFYDEATIAGLDTAITALAFEQNIDIVICEAGGTLDPRVSILIKEKFNLLLESGIDYIHTMGPASSVERYTSISLKKITQNDFRSLTLQHDTILSF